MAAQLLINPFQLYKTTYTFMILLALSLALPSIAYAKRYVTKAYCNDPDYKCIKVKPGQSWKSLFKDPVERDIVMRLNRVNGNPWGL